MQCHLVVYSDGTAEPRLPPAMLRKSFVHLSSSPTPRAFVDNYPPIRK